MEYRHGDVVLTVISEMPAGLAEIPRGERGVVLAEGEKTNHAHFISAKAASLFDGGGDATVKYCKVGGGGVTLRHEEHGPLKLPAGNYRVTIKRQYSPDGWESVRD